jgi:hypothetical protein
MHRLLAFFIIIQLISLKLYSQEIHNDTRPITIIKGTAIGIHKDGSTEILQFANIVLVNKKIGASCNHKGEYKIELDEKIIADTLAITYVGFKPKKIQVSQLTQGINTIDIKLEGILKLNILEITASEKKKKKKRK